MTFVLLGVDTEADNQWEAEGRRNLTVKNVHELPRLQEFCDRYEVRPTYLITHEMAVNPDARRVLLDLAETERCEIGAHHHPWTSPPKVEGHLYPLNLTPDHFREQLRQLTDAIAELIGQSPVSYRAGRNGFTGWQVSIMEEIGYLVDSSVDPFFNERRKGGPSFAGAPRTPYFLSREDPRRAGDSKLLEIPITSALNRCWPQWLETAYADMTQAYQFRRALRLMRVAQPVWLRPSYSKTKDMLALAERIVDANEPTANIIFHSSELMPGGSPYNQTSNDVDRFYAELGELLSFLTERGVRGATFQEFRNQWIEEQES